MTIPGLNASDADLQKMAEISKSQTSVDRTMRGETFDVSARTRSATFDERRHMLLVTQTGVAAGIPTAALGATLATRSGVLQLLFNTKGGDFETYLPIFERMLDSIQLETSLRPKAAGVQHSPQVSQATTVRQEVRRVFSTNFVMVIVWCVLGLVVVVYRARKRVAAAATTKR
jgi:hypothetical protein